MADEIPGPVRALVLARAGGACERCGREGVRLELHHRQYRSRGGLHVPQNLVALCGWGNHTGCHGWAHSEALAAQKAGFSIRSRFDPLTIPIHWHDQVETYLDSSGEYVAEPERTAP